MRVAICDDEKKIAELFSLKVRAEETESEISIYTSGIDLIQSGIEYDVVFLDIEMKTMDGFRVAEILHKRQSQCVFSFITIHAELAVDGYDYQPFRYILKTAPEPVIKRKISETLHEYYRRNKTLKTAYKGNYYTVLVNDIFYIEIKGHCMNIILENEAILWNKPLNEVEKELKNYDLVRCHRSFIVALSQIKEFSMKSIKLQSGHDIPIGRAYRKYFLESYQNFILTN